MRTIAVIPARGGSRRIPRKNVRQFIGRPMLSYSVDAARNSGVVDEVWVSTEDSKIAAVAWQLGCKLHPRSAALAEDNVGTQEVMRAAILELWPNDVMRPELAVCIYACAPTLLPQDLRHARLMLHMGWPYVYAHGMFYFGKTEAFMKDIPLTDGISVDLGERWVDVNTWEDWHRARAIVKRMERVAA